MSDDIDALAAHDIMIRAAKARTAAEWFDLYQHVVESNSVKMMVGQGAIMERIQDWRSEFIKVKTELSAMGLDLTEDLDIEDPPIYNQASGTWRVAPGGMTVIWPGERRLVFKGRLAVRAFCFLQWWVSFHDTLAPQYAPSRRTAVLSPDMTDVVLAKDPRFGTLRARNSNGDEDKTPKDKD